MKENIKQRWMDEKKHTTTSNEGGQQTKHNIERMRDWLDKGVSVGHRQTYDDVQRMKLGE